MTKKLFAAALFCALMSAFSLQTSAKARYPYLQNERFVARTMRVLHSAQVTYSATTGNGNYGSLSQLRAVYLINELLARGYANGYNFTITTVARTNNNEASFNVSAVPQIYGTTGIRSFYIDTSGVIYGADKHGEPANADDPPIQQ
ncbi:MAG: DUF2950 family protein [Pyrinomonadaceae bacterium]|nr:DUF2950 family protein [Pyrinomonadaceae bacterium]